jgi:hypothetical protein
MVAKSPVYSSLISSNAMAFAPFGKGLIVVFS